MLEKVIKIISKELIISFFCLVISIIFTVLLNEIYERMIIDVIYEVFDDFETTSNDTLKHHEIVKVLNDFNISNKEIIEVILTEKEFTISEQNSAKEKLYALNYNYWLFLFLVSLFIVYGIRIVQKLILIVCK